MMVKMKDVSEHEGASAVAAELAECEGGFAAEIVGDIEAALYGEVGAAAVFDNLSTFEFVAYRDGDRLPEGDRFAVEGGVGLCAGEGYGGGVVEDEGRASDGDFETGCFVVVAEDLVAEAEGVGVEGTGGRDADIPVSDASWVVLDGGLGPRFEDVDSTWVIDEAIAKFGGVLRVLECIRGKDIFEVLQVGLDPFDAGGGKSGRKVGDGFGAVGSLANDFGEEGIVEGGDFGGGFDPGVDASALREGDFSEESG